MEFILLSMIGFRDDSNSKKTLNCQHLVAKHLNFDFKMFYLKFKSIQIVGKKMELIKHKV